MEESKQAASSDEDDFKDALDENQQEVNGESEIPYPSGRYEFGYPTGGILCTKDADIIAKTVRFVLGTIGHNLITG